MTDLVVRPAARADRDAVDAIHLASWGGPHAAGHGTLCDLRRLPTLVAVDREGIVAGALTYHVQRGDLEVVSIDAVAPGHGAGTALLDAAVGEARRRGLRRVWLITTNDNLRALRFYQRRGMRIAAAHPGALDRSRELKPTIPEVGADRIPLRDELRLELRLTGEQDQRAAARSAAMRHVRGGTLDVWSLLADPTDTADVVALIANRVRGTVDAVTGFEETGVILAALVARELNVPYVRSAAGAHARAAYRVLAIEPGVPQPPVEGGSATDLVADPASPLASIWRLVDAVPSAVRDFLTERGVELRGVLAADDLAG